MQLTQKPWAVCLISAALLGGLSVSAQTTSETQPVTETETVTDATTTTDPQTSPRRSFVTDLAKASLAKDDGTEPATEASIQEQRDAGMGWGQIANALGLKLGAVVSAANANKPTESGRNSQSAAGSSRNGNGAGSSGGKSGGGGGGRGK